MNLKTRLFFIQLLFIVVFNNTGGINPLYVEMNMLLSPAMLDFYFPRELFVL